MMEREPRPVAIVLIGDHPRIRAGLHMRLALEPDLQIVAEAESVAALALATPPLPDLLLLDGDTAEDGLAATQALRLRFPAAGIILLCHHDSQVLLVQARAAGASAVIAKHTIDAALIPIIRQLTAPPLDP